MALLSGPCAHPNGKTTDSDQRVVEYSENKQALLHKVDLMLDLTNEETQRKLGRSVTEWEEFFEELETSWRFWIPMWRQ